MLLRINRVHQDPKFPNEPSTLSFNEMTRNPYRPAWLSFLLITLVLLVAIALLTATVLRSTQRLTPIHSHLACLDQLQQSAFYLEELTMRNLTSGEPVDLSSFDQRIDATIKTDGFLDPDTLTRLKQIKDQLQSGSQQIPADLIIALEQLRHIVKSETAAHDALLKSIDHDTSIELNAAITAGIALPLAAILLVFLLRNRILQPLNNLGQLMNRLARKDFSTVAMADVDPLLLPLFKNYNSMVTRLSMLEEEHIKRHHSLEHEIRLATETLLQQQSTLSRAERLAAVGELAAGLAHELRNPLAGIKMTLDNLRSEVTDPELSQRITLMSNELKRIADLLTRLLDQARQSPEITVDIQLSALVTELFSLIRYQIPEQIQLQSDIAEDIHCRLPEGGLRQAILNLVLNAADAIGKAPGLVTIKATIHKDNLRLSVLDDGPGFPQELLAHGIRPFATWRDTGTGLGLAMVRRFVHELGGELIIKNRDPRGACATLTFPCIKSHD